MAVLSGKDGGITFSSGYATKCTAWTVDIAIEDIDTTALGDSWRSRVAGLGDWSGTFDCLADGTTWSSDITEFGLTEAPAAAVFTLGTGEDIRGTIMITGMSVSSTVGGGPSTISFTYVGSATVNFSG